MGLAVIDGDTRRTGKTQRIPPSAFIEATIDPDLDRGPRAGSSARRRRLTLGLALFVFANNLRVSLLSSIFSATCFGIFAFLVPAAAFGQIGFVASTLQARGGSWIVVPALATKVGLRLPSLKIRYSRTPMR